MARPIPREFRSVAGEPAAEMSRPFPEANRIFLMQRLLHTYWRFARGMTLGVRGAAIDDQNRAFLIRHTYVRGWHLPGGGVEVGETALDALAREFWEEARIELTGEPSLHGVFFNGRVSRRDHVLVYATRRFRVVEPKQPDREIAEAGFFPLDRLPEDTTPATRRRLDEVATGRVPPVMW